MTVSALVVAGLLLLWMSLTYVTRPGPVAYLQRVLAGSYLSLGYSVISNVFVSVSAPGERDSRAPSVR